MKKPIQSPFLFFSSRDALCSANESAVLIIFNCHIFRHRNLSHNNIITTIGLLHSPIVAWQQLLATSSKQSALFGNHLYVPLLQSSVERFFLDTIPFASSAHSTSHLSHFKTRGWRCTRMNIQKVTRHFCATTTNASVQLLEKLSSFYFKHSYYHHLLFRVSFH